VVKRYQHVTDPIRQEIARRVGDAPWARPAVDKQAKTGKKGGKKARKQAAQKSNETRTEARALRNDDGPAPTRGPGRRLAW
jgi:hypothetical protein